MKTIRHCMVILVLALLFGCVWPLSVAYADDGAAFDIVGTEAELQAWIDDHSELGGTVYLGASITLTDDIWGGYGGGHVVIDTGRYGIVYDGGCIVLDDFEIIGEGVDTPVVTVVDAGWFWMGNWNNELAFSFITATGHGGTGGVALYVTSNDGSQFNTDMIYANLGCIRSLGQGALGIMVDEPMDLYCFNVEVDGPDSLAVSAPAGTVLYYSRLNVSGPGAAVASGGVTLDTCTAAPKPADAAGVTVITRSITDVSGKRFYAPVRQDDWIFIDASLTSALFWLSGSDGSEVLRYLPVDWDWDAIFAIDTGVLGSHTISGSLLAAFDGFGLTDDFPLELVIEVRDPMLPCFSRVFFTDYDGNSATLVTWDEYDPSADGFILWRSDDGGETWYDYTDSPNLDWSLWDFSFITFKYDSLEAPVMFCLEVVGVGESNVVTLYEKDGVLCGDTGGDRFGTDRQGGGSFPPGDTGGTGDNAGNGDGAGNPSLGNPPVGSPPVGTPPGGTTPGGNNPGGAAPGNSPSGSNSADGYYAAGSVSEVYSFANSIANGTVATSTTDGQSVAASNTTLSITAPSTPTTLPAQPLASESASAPLLPSANWAVLMTILAAAVVVLGLGALLWVRNQRLKTR